MEKGMGHVHTATVPCWPEMNGAEISIAESLFLQPARPYISAPVTVSTSATETDRTLGVHMQIRQWLISRPATAVGYFLGKRPYFHHLKEYVTSIWPSIGEVTAMMNEFFFFMFNTVMDMEDVIEVWIRLRHQPVELWTMEGLRTIASGVGKPLYPDAIMRACTRLNVARVCVILDIKSKLPKHIIIITSDEDGWESPCKVDVDCQLLMSIPTSKSAGREEIRSMDELWLVGGDFNAVRDLSEVCGTSGDIRMAMEEFNACIQSTALHSLPMQGEWYTWHNSSTTSRSLWKQLHRMLINDTWLTRFPTSCYTSLLPQTSDHSPLVLNGDRQMQLGGMFRFDNYLTLSPNFIPSVQNVWQHAIVGVPMYAITRKLKDLKPVFRQ
ncbi:UNVERIFIED_CONTAM: hypothetical protein Sindi_2669100 [Sesamum indicum]